MRVEEKETEETGFSEACSGCIGKVRRVVSAQESCTRPWLHGSVSVLELFVRFASRLRRRRCDGGGAGETVTWGGYCGKGLPGRVDGQKPPVTCADPSAPQWAPESFRRGRTPPTSLHRTAVDTPFLSIVEPTPSREPPGEPPGKTRVPRRRGHLRETAGVGRGGDVDCRRRVSRRCGGCRLPSRAPGTRREAGGFGDATELARSGDRLGGGVCAEWA